MLRWLLRLLFFGRLFGCGPRFVARREARRAILRHRYMDHF
jgi:hypothetical protein